jgi:hypothetical protein
MPDTTIAAGNTKAAAITATRNVRIGLLPRSALSIRNINHKNWRQAPEIPLFPRLPAWFFRRSIQKLGAT